MRGSLLHPQPLQLRDKLSPELRPGAKKATRRGPAAPRGLSAQARDPLGFLMNGPCLFPSCRFLTNLSPLCLERIKKCLVQRDVNCCATEKRNSWPPKFGNPLVKQNQTDFFAKGVLKCFHRLTYVVSGGDRSSLRDFGEN